jgi:hypothetical protein
MEAKCWRMFHQQSLQLCDLALIAGGDYEIIHRNNFKKVLTG